MLNTSNFWGFKASKAPNQNLIPGTSKWVSNEMNEANKLILQSSKYFSSLVNSELVWLNEQIVEILESKEDEKADALLLLRSPVKLTSRESPVRKIRQEAILDLKSTLDNESMPPKVLQRPLQPVFAFNRVENNALDKLEQKNKIVKEVRKITPVTKQLYEQEVPNLVPLNEKQKKSQSPQQERPAIDSGPSEESLLLRSAEKLGVVDIGTAAIVDPANHGESNNFDISFEAITRTIKPSKDGITSEAHTEKDNARDISKSPQSTKKSAEKKTETSKLPATTPVADRISFASFASLPSKEPLTVKSTKKERVSSQFSSASPDHEAKHKEPIYSSIYPPLSKLKPLPRSVLEDHKDEDSPFKISRNSTSKDRVPPSAKEKKSLVMQLKLENLSSNHKAKESPLNSIFANAIKRAKNFISPSRNESKPNTEENEENAKSVKRVVSSKGTRGNLMDRLTADTESSAARNIKKLDLQPTNRLYPEIESPLSKKYNISPLAKKYNTELKPTKSIPPPTSIPKLPVFERKTISPVRNKPPISAPKRKTGVMSPEKIITKHELSKVNGKTIASTTSEIQRKRLKTQESLTSIPLNRNTAQHRKSNGSQLRINKKMAEERLRVEELRKQRLSNTHKMISIDLQLRQPLHRMREKSLKANEQVSHSQDTEIDDKLSKRKIEMDAKATVLAPLSDEAMNKRRKTEDKFSDQKVPKLSIERSNISTSETAAPTTSTSTSAKTQTLMRTAMIQHARFNKSSSTLKQTESSKSSYSTPTVKSIRKSSTPQSNSPLVLPEIFSEPEDDDEGHVLKDWAESPELKKLLYKQQAINPDAVFGAIAPLNMDEIFHASRAAKFRARSSSAHWGVQDMLSHKEADEYRKKMGWKK